MWEGAYGKSETPSFPPPPLPSLHTGRVYALRRRGRRVPTGRTDSIHFLYNSNGIGRCCTNQSHTHIRPWGPERNWVFRNAISIRRSLSRNSGAWIFSPECANSDTLGVGRELHNLQNPNHSSIQISQMPMVFTHSWTSIFDIPKSTYSKVHVNDDNIPVQRQSHCNINYYEPWSMIMLITFKQLIQISVLQFISS